MTLQQLPLLSCDDFLDTNFGLAFPCLRYYILVTNITYIPAHYNVFISGEDNRFGEAPDTVQINWFGLVNGFVLRS
jgi:hypothetical protein